MSNLLQVLQGGRIRANFVTNSSTTYSRGQAIYINSSGLLTKYDGTPAVTVGLALEQCVSAATGNPMDSPNIVVAGKTGSILLGQSLVLTDNLSGVGFSVGSRVYAQNDGNLTYNSGLGVAPLGRAVVSSASNGQLTFYMDPDVSF